ncbi:TraR/DksA family transcriptional regulator [Williamsia sterculiae]|uniref:Transcriptional regulator, TraR/DksA family n=1 Tax=Williamsia sterculiae TaxID=1344003 RepID=A0A1N7GWS6_9NOCA|nr:TraR/DksA C4-type zinc finger protein [Williamsia sterculiae]SIS17047.1 transcriptional regulator, TraR/DksA family [Williamsia sterculiae]
MPLDRPDPDHARRALLDERVATSALRDSMSARLRSVVDAASEATADDEHDPEGSTLAFERGQLVAQIERSTERLSEIEAALTRLDTGAYGVCESCGDQIAPARLDALPATRLCIRCASARTSRRRW